jgi:hypothetical protein
MSVNYSLTEDGELAILEHAGRLLRTKNDPFRESGVTNRYALVVRDKHPSCPFPLYLRLNCCLGDFSLEFYMTRYRTGVPAHSEGEPLSPWSFGIATYTTLDLLDPKSLKQKTLRDALKLALKTEQPLLINGMGCARLVTAKHHGLK